MRLLIELIAKVISLWFIVITKIWGFYSVSQRISTIPYFLGIRIRYFYYKKTLRSLGKNVIFSFGTILSHREISIGDNVRIGPYNTIGLVDIGDDFLSAQFVHLMSGKNQHSFSDINVPIRKQNGTLTRIKIADDVWVGVNSVITANLGKGVVVGASSVVLHEVVEYSVVVGNPAKVLKSRR